MSGVVVEDAHSIDDDIEIEVESDSEGGWSEGSGRSSDHGMAQPRAAPPKASKLPSIDAFDEEEELLFEDSNHTKNSSRTPPISPTPPTKKFPTVEPEQYLGFGNTPKKSPVPRFAPAPGTYVDPNDDASGYFRNARESLEREQEERYYAQQERLRQQNKTPTIDLNSSDDEEIEVMDYDDYDPSQGVDITISDDDMIDDDVSELKSQGPSHHNRGERRAPARSYSGEELEDLQEFTDDYTEVTMNDDGVQEPPLVAEAPPMQQSATTAYETVYDDDDTEEDDIDSTPTSSGMEASGVRGSAAAAATPRSPPQQKAPPPAPDPEPAKPRVLQNQAPPPPPPIVQEIPQKQPPPPPPPPGPEGVRASEVPPPTVYAPPPDPYYPPPPVRDVEQATGLPPDKVSRSVLSAQDRRSRCTVTWLLVVLAFLLICAGALAGGVVGALVFASPKPAPAPAPAPTPGVVTPEPTAAAVTTTAAPTGGRGATVAPTAAAVPGATGAPTPAVVGTTVSPTASGVGATTVGPTTSAGATTVPPTAGTTAGTTAPTAGQGGDAGITNQALYDSISRFAPDAGASIQTAGTPQNTAFLSVQTEVDSGVAMSETQQVQRYALRAIYYSTNGDSWTTNTGWTTTENECTWYSSFANPASICDATTGAYLILELVENNVSGDLPPEVGMLTSLTRLSVKATPESGVGLSSVDFAALMTLPLTVLVLNDHFLSASELPQDVSTSSWSALKVLSLANNDLQGRLPEVYGTALESVTNFNVANNTLLGQIPDAMIVALPSVAVLTLANNSLTGAIPADFTTMTAVRGINLGHNLLTGAIPDGLGSVLTLKSQLDLSHNNLEGAIPASLAKLVSLTKLDLQNNALTGAVPDTSGMVALTELFLQNNQLTGSVAACASTATVVDCGANANPAVECTCCTMCCDGGGAAC